MPRNPAKTQPYSYERSWNYVLWLLSRKAYTRKELEDKLKRKGAALEDTEKVMLKLEGLGYLDDASYAEMYVKSRQHTKGINALRRELLQKGISDTILQKTLAGLEEDSQTEAALKVLEQQAWRFGNEEPRKRYAKAYAFLARRGFQSATVSEALELSNLLKE